MSQASAFLATPALVAPAGRARAKTRVLSLVIPAYNEEAGIALAIAEADQALTNLDLEYEILIVDDGSHDGTAENVRRTIADYPRVRLIRHVENRGYGAALRSGFEAAGGDTIAFTDADCQFHIEDLNRLLPLLRDHAMAVGYRMDRQDCAKRLVYSWGYNALVRTLLGTRVRDCDCALKVFRRSSLAAILPESRGFFVNAEMLSRARGLGMRIAEAGVRHRPRLAGRSKVSILDIFPVLVALLPFWWTRVLFPAVPAVRSCELRLAGWARGLDLAPIILIAMAGLLFFARLRSPLLEPEESRYAEIPRQMLFEHRWIVPVIHGEPYLQKPPLLYWLVMISYSMFGVHDWAARLVPSTAGLATVLLTYWWGRRGVGSLAAFLGAMILCLSPRFVYMSRMVTMDGLLALFVLISWLCGHRALASRRSSGRYWILAAVACGLGILTKGPVALVLAAAPLVAYRMLDRRSVPVGYPKGAALVLLALGVAAPWYVAAAWYTPGFLSEFLLRHNLLRYVTPFDHEEPFWYYVPLLFLGMMPWTLLGLPLIRGLVGRPAMAARKRPAAMGFFFLAFACSFVFYSLAGCKRPGYILPAMPPLALALGCYMRVRLPKRPAWRVQPLPQLQITRNAPGAVRISNFGFGAWDLGFGFCNLSLARLPHVLTVGVMAVAASACVAASFAGLAAPAHAIPMAGVFLVAALYLLTRGPRPKTLAPWTGCALATFVVLLVGVHELWPGYAHKFSVRAQVRPQKYFADDPALPVACYPHRWDSVSFYLGRPDVATYTSAERELLIRDLARRPRTLLFVKSDHYCADLVKSLPPNLEFEAYGKNGLVTAGIVRHCSALPDSLHAGR
jgi:dolichol-phosphate mannosyltransferase